MIYMFIYLIISIGVTVKVGSMLHTHGTVFLTHHLQGLETLAKSINNLLLVGFYLLNIGYILIVMNIGDLESDPMESLSTHLGIVLLSLGLIHFVLLRVLVMWRPRFVRDLEDQALAQELADSEVN
jgi:hypothetical protein